MATGRFLKKIISSSIKYSKLKNHTNRMIYLTIFPHLDVKGRLSGNPKIIKGQVFALIDDLSVTKIENGLKDMQETGLINLYEVDGEYYLEYTKFADHQKLREDREALSDFPPNPCSNDSLTPGVLQSKSGELGQLPEKVGQLPEEIGLRHTKPSNTKTSEVILNGKNLVNYKKAVSNRFKEITGDELSDESLIKIFKQKPDIIEIYNGSDWWLILMKGLDRFEAQYKRDPTKTRSPAALFVSGVTGRNCFFLQSPSAAEEERGSGWKSVNEKKAMKYLTRE